MISVEDLRLSAGADKDYRDFRFAIQFLYSSGESMAPIPEPAHFGALLGLAVTGGAIYRRRRVQQSI